MLKIFLYPAKIWKYIKRMISLSHSLSLSLFLSLFVSLSLFLSFLCLSLLLFLSLFQVRAFFSSLPFSFLQSFNYTKSVFYAQQKLCDTPYTIFFTLLVVVTISAPALSSFLGWLCLGVFTHMLSWFMLVIVKVELKPQVIYSLLQNEKKVFLFSSFSDGCLDRFFSGHRQHLNFMAASN